MRVSIAVVCGVGLRSGPGQDEILDSAAAARGGMRGEICVGKARWKVKVRVHW